MIFARLPRNFIFPVITAVLKSVVPSAIFCHTSYGPSNLKSAGSSARPALAVRAAARFFHPPSAFNLRASSSKNSNERYCMFAGGMVARGIRIRSVSQGQEATCLAAQSGDVHVPPPVRRRDRVPANCKARLFAHPLRASQHALGDQVALRHGLSAGGAGVVGHRIPEGDALDESGASHY